MTTEATISSEPTDHRDHLEAASGAENVTARRVGVLVLGMHRSGTSALTGMLNLLGCSLPKTLIPANPTNEAGHWESAAIAQLNDEIFAQAGTHWDDWLPVNPRLSETEIWPLLVARGRDVLREEFAQAPLFVLKDPRLCKLAGFWTSVLAAESVNTGFVLPVRNPLEVVRSLAKRDRIGESQALLIWLRHVLAAEAATRGRSRVFTGYTELLNDWETLAGRVAEGLGLVFPRVSVLSASEVAQFLTPEMRHHVSDTGELGSNPAISPWITKTYDVLLGWSRNGERAADHLVLDAITKAFDEAGAAFARPMFNAAQADWRAAQATAQRDVLAEERDRVTQRVGEVEAELTRTAQARHEFTLRVSEVEAELARTVAERDTLAEARDKFAWRVGEVEAELARTVAERDTLAEARDAAAWRLGEVEAELARTVGDRNQLAELRDKVAWRLGEVEAELAQAAASHASELEQLRHCAHELRDSLAKAEQDSRHNWDSRRDLKTQLRDARLSLEQFDAERQIVNVRVIELECAVQQSREEANQAWVALAAEHEDGAVLRVEIEEIQVRHKAAEKRSADTDAWVFRLAQARQDVETQRRQLAVRLAQSEKARIAAEAEAKRHLDSFHRVQGVATSAPRELAATQARCGGLELQLADVMQSADIDRAAVQARCAQLEQQLASASAGREAAERARAEIESLKIAQGNENAVLIRQLDAQSAAIHGLGHDVEWLRNVHCALATTPAWWGFMPQAWRDQALARRLQRRQLFDSAAYLAKYPDVAQEKMIAVRHYIYHGMGEGRTF